MIYWRCLLLPEIQLIEGAWRPYKRMSPDDGVQIGLVR